MPGVEKETELLPGQQNVDLGCSVGRGLANEQRLGGLDWTAPCPLPVEHVVWLADVKVELTLCGGHNRVMEELGLLHLVSRRRQ